MRSIYSVCECVFHLLFFFLIVNISEIVVQCRWKQIVCEFFWKKQNETFVLFNIENCQLIKKISFTVSLNTEKKDRIRNEKQLTNNADR